MGGSLKALDQTLLPHREEWVEFKTHLDVVKGIREMVVRGAPLLGIVGAFGVVLAVRENVLLSGISATTKRGLIRQGLLTGPDLMLTLESAAETLAKARPTARNLSWGVEEVMKGLRRVQEQSAGPGREEASLPSRFYETAMATAQEIWDKDIAMNIKTAELTAELLPASSRVLTYCNTGSLATGGYGTALGAVFEAYNQGKLERVFVCETRPRLQGASLTVWELNRYGVPYTLITDNAAGYLMRRGSVTAVIVGSDRILKSGFAVNKIGTYTLSVLAKEHGIPFYIVAPSSTVDESTLTEESVVIEERSPDEVRRVGEEWITLPGVTVLNPAFDITPPENISAIITDKGVFRGELT